MIILALVFGTLLLLPVVMFLTICFVNIILADTLILSLFSGGVLYGILHLHPALCILAGGIVFAGITMLCMREKWFRILEWSSMLICGYLASFLVHDISGGDRLWTWFAGMLVCTLNYVLHEYARHRMCAGS